MVRAISATTASTYDKSAAPLSPCGVPTAINTASLFSTASPRSVVKTTESAAVLGQQLRQVLLEDGHAAVAELIHLGFVVVHADHAVADLGKTRSRHKSHVTGPDHTD